MVELFSEGKSAKINKVMHERCMERLDAAQALSDMNVPGYDFHALSGFKPTRHTVHVNGPCCITFEFDTAAGNALRVDFEQYHRAIMDEIVVTRRPSRCPTHPGAVLRKTVLPALGLTVTEVAARLHVTRQQLHRVLSEQSGISPEMALRLGKFCGNGSSLWMRMQAAYDLWQAERKIGADVATIATVQPAQA